MSPSGERVVEPYGGGVSASHAHATSAAGGGRGSHVSGEAEAPQPVDPALLTSIDLESDHPRREMPVTDTAQHHHNHHHRHHDLNHNDHVFVHKPPGGSRLLVRREAGVSALSLAPLGHNFQMYDYTNYLYDVHKSC